MMSTQRNRQGTDGVGRDKPHRPLECLSSRKKDGREGSEPAEQMLGKVASAQVLSLSRGNQPQPEFLQELTIQAHCKETLPRLGHEGTAEESLC